LADLDNFGEVGDHLKTPIKSGDSDSSSSYLVVRAKFSEVSMRGRQAVEQRAAELGHSRVDPVRPVHNVLHQLGCSRSFFYAHLRDSYPVVRLSERRLGMRQSVIDQIIAERTEQPAAA
jgi:predicted DNA-binding transcriptional regulator AlpA